MVKGSGQCFRDFACEKEERTKILRRARQLEPLGYSRRTLHCDWNRSRITRVVDDSFIFKLIDLRAELVIFRSQSVLFHFHSCN